MSSKILTTKGSAEYLQVAVKTMANWRVMNRGPKYIKYPQGSIRYRASDLDAWLGEHVVDTYDSRQLENAGA